MTIKSYMQTLGTQAREASRVIAAAETSLKNQALLAIADALDRDRENLLAANAVDMENGRKNGLDAALLDRLELNPARIDGMIEGLQQVSELPDPIGEDHRSARSPKRYQARQDACTSGCGGDYL